MRILGLPVPFTQDWRGAPDGEKALQAVDNRRSLWGIIYESFAGAWQQNVEIRTEDILRHPAVQACLALISGDVGKLPLELKRRDRNGIWVEVYPPVNPIFSKPNHYQTRTQFFEQWVLCLLIWGNVYVLKERDRQGNITAYFILDPRLVRTLVSDDGQVFYELLRDNLTGLTDDRVAAPASEIIHDRYKPKYHPLVGIPPIEACALAAAQGMSIQKNSTFFFRNGSRPGGILTAEGPITKDTAERLKAAWDTNYTGENTGKVAVLGDGLKYQSMEVTAQNSQAVEQLKLTNEMVAMCFLVPLWKIGAGQMPAYGNVQAANIDYYSTCLQTIIENMEALLDDGMALGADLGVEFNVDGLLRMDTAGQMESLDKGKNILKPDEARKRLQLPPVEGGDAVYRQQQDFSLAALARRDAQENPFATGTAAPASPDGEATADVQATAFNGAQVTALLAIIAAVTEGTMPPQSASAAIAAAFPALSPDEIAAIVDPLVGFKPSNDNEDAGGEDDEGERAMASVLAELQRGLA